MKLLKRVLIVSLLLVLAMVPLAACEIATLTPVPTPTSQYVDTPTLINQAFARGEITKEERLLYLAYALYEYKSLPPQYHSSVEWSGTLYAEEIGEVLRSPLKLCFMSPHIRSEFQRLLHPDTICK